MINLQKQSIIYIVCTANAPTGGTELLHQLCYNLNKFGYNAQMYYVPNNTMNPISDRFLKYKVKYVTSISDNKYNVLIVPEVYTNLLVKYANVKKVIWWLSIDNYYGRLKNIKTKIKMFIGIINYYSLKRPDNSVYHLVQSYYAYDFLKNKQIKNIEFLSDYINDDYINDNISYLAKDRDNICFYNPKKGYEFTKLIIDKSKDNIKWIALENMNVNQIKGLLRKGKVYIDFGNHPGKDRFPREAAISGCCIITGKQGAAKFYQDIPIDDKYKFDDDVKNVDKIIETINLCLNNYDTEVKNFQGYRDMIVNEKDKFKKDLLSIFKRV